MTGSGAPGPRSAPEVVELPVGLGGDALVREPAPHPADFAAPPSPADLERWADADRAARPARLARLRERLAREGVDAYFGLRPENGRYLTGFRLGDGEPSNLVELVRQPRTRETALAVAKQIFEAAELQVAVCGDFAGRIIDRLVRPYYNAALRRLDEALASADDLDTTLKLGLGYPEGPIALLERTGLAHHFDVTQALFEAYGEPAYAPARRARVAKLRQKIIGG